MKVHDIMVPNPAFCYPKTNLAEATALMWQHNCGSLPVLDHDGRVTGILTDRDICIALGTRNQRASEVLVDQVMTGRHITCYPESDVHEALRSMEDHRVHRLPVVDHEGHLKAIISIDDIVLNAQWAETHTVDLSFVDVIRVLRKVTHPAKPCVGSM
jgi:CBS domain-containing protein